MKKEKILNTRGALFEKTAPLDPPQKLLLKVFGGPGPFFQKGSWSPKAFVILIILLLIPFVITAQKEEQRVSHVLGKDKVTVVPDVMLRGYDPVTVFFPGETGPAGGGPVDQPGNLLRIEPGHPGEYRWVDARTLQFLPTIPWPALERYKISAGGSEFTVSTFMAPPVRLTPADGSTDLEPLTEVNMSFSQPIDVKKLAVMITFEVRALPGVSSADSYWLTAKDFVIKEMERVSINEPVGYRVTLHKPVPYGKLAILHLRLSLDSNIPGSLARYTFSTRPLFRLVEVAPGSSGNGYPVAIKGSVYSQEQAMDCGTGSGLLYLRFSDTLGSVSVEEIKQMVRFSPAVSNFRHEVSGDTIHLMFDADRGKQYQLNLLHVPVRSYSGRELTEFGPTSLYFFFRVAEPYLKWLAGQGLLECYGPQVFPMEGRNQEQVDLRVYKINPLNRNFWPYPANPVEIDESKRPKGPGEEPPYTTELREQIRLLGSPLVSRLVPLPLKTGSGMRFGLDLKESFARISGENRPGTYLVGYRSIGKSTQRSYVWVQVTDLCLSTVEEDTTAAFVVTSLKTGLPVVGARIEVEGIKDGKWETIISGESDVNGIYRYKHTHRIEHRIARIIVSRDQDVLVLNPNNPPPYFMNNHWYKSYNNWLYWLNSEPNPIKSQAVMKAHILTERPVYRPEESVHIKGYVRSRQQGKITQDNRKLKYAVEVVGPGDKHWTYPVQLTPYGSFYYEFAEKDLPTGEYLASINYQWDQWNRLAEVKFRKESYRVPRFEVRLSGPEKAGLDEPFQVTMSAVYYAGGPVVGQDVQWRVTQFPYFPPNPGYEGFLFSSDQRFSGIGSETSLGSIAKSDISDDKGLAVIDIDPTREKDSQSRKYVIEATVRGADEQTVTATHAVLALSPFVLGMKVERVLQTGMTINPQVLVLGFDGKPQAGKEFHLKLLQRQWHSYLQESDFTTGKAKYVTDVVDVLISEADYTSEAGIKTISLPVKESGVYVVEISARDKQGRQQKVQTDLFVAGETPVTWKKPKANVFETTADKPSYNPGGTANILLKSPFQEAQALAVVEGPAANTYHWIMVKNGQAIFKLAITGDMHPRVPVHFLLMRGRLATKTNPLVDGKEDRAKPISMASTTWLTVNPRNNQLEITLNHEKRCLPGAKMKMDIKMLDPDGKPLNGEVALWLVDRAVLALGKEKRLDPLPSFIDPVESMLTVRDTRSSVVGNLSPEEVPGGEEAEMEPKSEISIFDKVTVRKNFKTVPYFNPSIVVTNGVASVEIQLPDNLTDFAIRAVATDGEGRFGATKSMVSIRLPLIVQPALPRFVRPGDQFNAGGIGRVVEGEGGPGKAELLVTGLEVQGDSQYPVSWAIGKPEKVFFQLKVPEQAAEKKDASVTVKLAVRRDTDQAMDAFEIQLPVKPDKTGRRLEKFVTLEPGKAVPFPTPLEGARPGTMNQSILVTPEAALVKMLAALDYLARYEHGCTEQRVSRLMPQLALKEVMDNIGRPVQTEILKREMAEMFTFLEACLTPDGLYSFWPGSKGYVSITAYVVEFLLLAKQDKYPYKPLLLERGIAALKESLRSDYRYFIDGYSFVERAAALTALAKAKYFDDAYAHDLMTRSLSMDLYSEANILYAFLIQDKPYKAAVDRLSQDLWKSLVFKLRDGKEVYEGLQFRSETRGGLILSSEVRTMASVARTLHKAQPENKRVRLLVDELVSRGAGDGWGCTNANAAALLALGQVIGTPQPAAKGNKLELTFGKDTQTLDTKGKTVTRFDSKEMTPGSVKMLSGDDERQPLAWLIMDYIPDGTGDKVKSNSNGFAVTREILVYKGQDQPPSKYNAEAGQTLTLDMGTIIEEHIRVVNSEQRYYVAIQAPFAAGFEPLNPNLATAPPEATPAGTMTRKPDYAIYADDSVTFYYDSLAKGTYDFYFRLRASIEGSYAHPPAKAELMYQLSVNGNSDGTRIKINARNE